MIDLGWDGNDKLFYCRESYRQIHGFEPREGSNTLQEEDGHPCKVVFRSADRNRFGEYRYIAHIEFELFDAKKGVETKQDEYLFDLPRDAFFFEDLEYTRDHALENAFRHDIRIPDDIMPKAWLDRLVEE